MRQPRTRIAALLFALSLSLHPEAAVRVDVLRPVGGLPPHIVGLFEDPLGFQQAPGDLYLVFDRRAHSVYAIDAAKTAARKLVEIGQEMGRIIQPRGFDVAPNGTFVIADAPRGQERIQVFNPEGLRQSGFFTEYSLGGQELRKIANMPTRWPTRRVTDREVPHVAPTVRAAAVNAQGELWIALTVPYTYVYDAHGDKARTVQFNAAGIFSPASLSFTRAGRLLVTPGAYEFDPSAR